MKLDTVEDIGPRKSTYLACRSARFNSLLKRQDKKEKDKKPKSYCYEFPLYYLIDSTPVLFRVLNGKNETQEKSEEFFNCSQQRVSPRLGLTHLVFNFSTQSFKQGAVIKKQQPTDDVTDIILRIQFTEILFIAICACIQHMVLKALTMFM